MGSVPDALLQVHKASAVKEFTGVNGGRGSRDRLARVRGYTTSTGRDTALGSNIMDSSSKTMQVGSPFATLLLLCAEHLQPPTYAIGILVATEPPTAGSDEVNGQMVKGRLMQLVYGGDTPVFEWEMRKLDKTNHEYSCSCLLYTSPSPRDLSTSRMPSSA